MVDAASVIPFPHRHLRGLRVWAQVFRAAGGFAASTLRVSRLCVATCREKKKPQGVCWSGRGYPGPARLI